MKSSLPRRFSRCGLFAVALVAPVLVFAMEKRSIEEMGLTLLPVPAGSFTMGSPEGEPRRGRDEGPATQVKISKAFWLGRTEVTYAQWRAVMMTDLLDQAKKALADDKVYLISGKERTVRGYYNYKPETTPERLVDNAADDAPMYWVSWEEAVEFCRRLNDKERAAKRLPDGYEYRLPTEAEWEYACRAGTTTATYAGQMEILGSNHAPVLDEIGWYNGNSSVGYTGGGKAGQRAVASKKPNAWGFHDMIGNVWEWCADYYVNKLPGVEVSDPRGPENGKERVSRGGAWNFPPGGSRSAKRFRDEPSTRFKCIGFRVALAPKLPL